MTNERINNRIVDKTFEDLEIDLFSNLIIIFDIFIEMLDSKCVIFQSVLCRLVMPKIHTSIYHNFFLKFNDMMFKKCFIDV